MGYWTKFDGGPVTFPTAALNNGDKMIIPNVWQQRSGNTTALEP